MFRRNCLLWIIVLTVLGGCARPVAAPFGDGGGGDTGSGAENLDSLRQQAREALARYDAAVRDAGGKQGFVPVGELTGTIGELEPANYDYKNALNAGRLVAAVALPAAPRPTGAVVWDSGATQQLPLISAKEAFDQAVADGAGGCPDCVPVQISGASLGTARIDTSRGVATVPAWVYSLKGTGVRLTRVAVARSAEVRVTPPSWDPYNPPGGLSITSASTSANSTRLVVDLVGRPNPRSQPCGADYSGESVESANAVVVIVIEHPHATGEMCDMVGASRTATVELTRPVGERAVLDVRQGLPVPVTLTP